MLRTGSTAPLPECASLRTAPAEPLGFEAGSKPWNLYAQGQPGDWLASAPLQIPQRLQLPGIALAEADPLEQSLEDGLMGGCFMYSLWRSMSHRRQDLGEDALA